MRALSTDRTELERPPRVTLGRLLDVLSEITSDEDEIVATALHMVSAGRVELVGPYDEPRFN